MSQVRGLTDVLRGFCVLLSDVALICLAVMLVPLLTRLDISIGYEVWILYLLLQFLISYGMMTAGVSVNLYLLVETALVAAGTWLTCRTSLAQTAAVSGNRLMGELLLCIGMGAAATGIHGAWAAYRLPGSNGILRYVDCLIVALAFYLYAAYEIGETGDRRLLGIALAAVLLNLLAVNQLRTGEECPSVIQGAGTGGRLLLGLIFLVCLAVTGAVVGLASGQVHSLVDVLLLILAGIWRVVEAVLVGFSMVLGYIILFFIALLPNAPPAVEEKASELVQEGAEAVAETAGKALPLWVWQLLLAAGIAAGILAVLHTFRHKKLRRVSVRARKKKVVRKSHFFSSLAGLARRAGDWLGFRWMYLRHRRTPQGLFVLAECAGRRGRVKRSRSESPGEYLRRLDAAACKELAAQETGKCGSRTDGGYSDGNSRLSLHGLADILDQVFYGGRDIGLTAEEYDGYRRQIKNLADKIK